MVKVKKNPVKKHTSGALAEIHCEQRQTTCAIPKIAVARYGLGTVTIRHKCYINFYFHWSVNFYVNF